MEVWQSLIPGTKLGSFFAESVGLPPEMKLRVEFIGIVIIHSICKQIHSWSRVEDL